MTILLEKVIDGKRYTVELDQDANNRLFMMDSKDFGDEEVRDWLRDKISKGELELYFVCEEELCACCGQWKHLDSLGFIEDEDPESALNYYLEVRG